MDSKDNWIKDKKYRWPDVEQANGSGNITRPTKLICGHIQVLGEIIHDLAKVIAEQKELPEPPKP